MGTKLTGMRHDIVCLGVGNALYLNRDLNYTAVCISQNSLTDTYNISACIFYLKRKWEGMVELWTLVSDVYAEVLRVKCTDVYNFFEMHLKRWIGEWIDDR